MAAGTGVQLPVPESQQAPAPLPRQVYGPQTAPRTTVPPERAQTSGAMLWQRPQQQQAAVGWLQEATVVQVWLG